MVEPVSVGASSLAKVASSVVTKQLQSKAGVRLGSRDERRRVYTRFQEAVTDSYTTMGVVHLEQRLHSIFVGKRRWQISYRPWAAAGAGISALAAMRQSQAEVLHAYLDLRLVANPEPLRAADKVLDRLNEVFDLRVGVKAEVLTAAASAVAEAQREFVDVCRDDLWYLPKRWQFYRLGWWRGRRWRKPQST